MNKFFGCLLGAMVFAAPAQALTVTPQPGVDIFTDQLSYEAAISSFVIGQENFDGNLVSGNAFFNEASLFGPTRLVNERLQGVVKGSGTRIIFTDSIIAFGAIFNDLRRGEIFSILGDGALLATVEGELLGSFLGFKVSEEKALIELALIESDLAPNRTQVNIDGATVALAPVPLPTAAIPFLTALLCLGWYGRRHRRQQA